MTSLPTDCAHRLTECLAEFDLVGAAEVVGQYVQTTLAEPEPPDPGLATQVLETLRKHRRFDLLEQVTDVLRQLEVNIPLVRVYYAQALIEGDLLIAARTVLDTALAAEIEDENERGEVQGLLGRVYKQMFVRAGEADTSARSTLLAAAVERYLRGYDSGADNLWQGVNAAALLLHAGRNGLALSLWPDPADTGRQIARDILAALDAPERQRTGWDHAIAFEASLALDRTGVALHHLGKFLTDSDLGAFGLAALLRQLKEIWQLQSDRQPGSMIIPQVQTRLLQAEGGALPLDAADLRAGRDQPDGRNEGFEKVFGLEDFEPQSWFEQMLERCQAVARIETDQQDGIGTGFLVAGASLNPAWPEVVLITNEHVISDDRDFDDLVVAFRGVQPPVFANVLRRLHSSPRGELDFAVVEISTFPQSAKPCGLAKGLPKLPVPAGVPPHRLYVIGHPLGAMTLRIAIHDNVLLASDERVAHYRCPTEPGSSGSPVFDRRWNVVALHHSGRENMARLRGTGTYQANEGIRFNRIVESTMAAVL